MTCFSVIFLSLFVMTCFIEICACCKTDLKNIDFRNYVYRSDSAVIYGTISDFLLQV